MPRNKKDVSRKKTKPVEKKSPFSIDNKLPQLTTTNTRSAFLIVALGASAGGLETFEEFFQAMPTENGMAFIVVTHLDPDHTSFLADIIQRYTRLEVITVVSGLKVQPNKVYVLPPGKNLVISGSILYLENLNPDQPNLPIDFFLRSLALDQGSRGVCIILSGTGTDGTAGLRTLREKGGLIIVQSAKSARYDGMPKSAISTGLVDYILTPDKMPEYLLKYQAYFNDKSVVLEDRISDEIEQILLLLHSYTGHDFSLYKPNTIFRRIQKRMSIHQLDSIAAYLRYIHQHTYELEILFKELLINVTNFFRDPDAFEILKHELMTRVLKNKAKDNSVRVWVPGCSTGEEAYSIAIILQECMDNLQRYFSVQIFGTDIDDEAVEFARAGVYPVNIALDISPERLSRFFNKENNVYKISKDIRKMIIFATQDVIKDPPFTKLDLISCRNLLIYLSSQLQKKLLPLFHYSLKREGLLFLGNSETIGGSVELFEVIDRKWKLFQRKSGHSSFQAVMDFPAVSPITEVPPLQLTEKSMQSDEPKLSQLVEKVLLEHYAPACVIIDEQDNIIYIHGSTGKFLEFASGEARLNVIAMARIDLKLKLTTAIKKVRSQNREIVYAGIQIKDGKEFKCINLRIRPIPELEYARKLLLIIFEDMITFEQAGNIKGKRSTRTELDTKIAQLEQELKYTKESLQTTIEELETSNEELKSSNEELQSTNEELQSTNEEIETSKEELQSLNEELTTVNAELESRIDQLSSANDDIKNLLDNTEIATIFLDKELCIKRFTPKATDIIHLIATDVGRPINHIVSNLNYEKLLEDARLVLKTLESKTIEVQDKKDRWYVVKIIPYRTVTNMIDGVVITFLNIHAQKQAEKKLSHLEVNLRTLQEVNLGLIDNMPQPVILLGEGSTILCVNQSFCEKFNVESHQLSGKNIYEIAANEASYARLNHLAANVDKTIVLDEILVKNFNNKNGAKLSAKLTINRLAEHAALIAFSL